ncbi:MAG: aminotransferase class III-fold pyridoxal phosphate-dependent enzyme, partial [Saprospiraceae bacterium]
MDDKEYLDFVMSYGVAMFGHSPDFIMDAVREQLAKGTGLDTLTPLATEVAQIICELSGMDRMTLANTGTEAVVGAVRAARAATGRDKIIIFDTDYHGLTDEYMLRGITVRGNTKAVPLAPGIPKAVMDSVVILDWDDPQIIEKIRLHADDLAAVLIEPVQAQNPHWQHDEILHEIRKVTQELDVALIFDEVINGFRLLQGGAQEWFGIEADLVAYGKTISGGLPCAAFAGKHKYMDVFDGGIWQFGDDSAPEAMPTYFAGTFIKNPVSVAASLAAMREIQRLGKELQLELNAKTVRFTGQLRDLFLRLQAPIFVQSTSSIFTVKFADKNPTNALFYSILRYHGVNMRARPCFVSTAHTEADFSKALKLVERTLTEMLDNGLMDRYEGEDLNDIYVREGAGLLNFQSLVNLDDASNHLRTTSEQLPNYLGTKIEDEDSLTDKNVYPPLTEGQQEIFLNHQFSEEAAKAYNIGTEIKLAGQLNEKAFFTAIQLLINRHEALRTTINTDGKSQQILRERPLPIDHIDLSNEKEADREMALANYRVETMERAFDLQNDHLSRWKLFKLDADEYILFLTVHHIICDGWSLGILTRELGELYARECGLEHQNLGEAKQLSAYAKESTTFTNSPTFRKNQRYWLNQFADGVPTVEIPTDFKRPPLKTYNGSSQKINFSAELTQQFRKAAAKQGTTLYVYMLSAFSTFLQRWSQEEDLILGVAAAGHNLPGNGNVVGHLINLLPVRLKVGASDTFAQQIKQTRGQILDAFDHQQYTFGTLVRELKMQRDSSRNALISVAFNMDSPLNDLNYGNVLAKTKGVPHRYETFDIFINLKPVGKAIDFEWNFNTDLYQSELISYRLQEFKTLLESALQTPDATITELNILPNAALNLIQKWSRGTVKKYPIQETLHRLMSRQAAWTPDKVAFVFKQNELTFGELEKRSDQLAFYLLAQGLAPKSFVGLSLNRSLDMIVAMFAILKTGCAYVPIDPRNPQERIAMLLEDADCQALLTTSDLGLLNFKSLVNLTVEVDKLSFK